VEVEGVVMQGAMLVTRVGAVVCGFPVEHVVETMRPLPIDPVGRSGDAALAAIEGLAIIRGVPVPVVDVRKLLGVTGEGAARFVVVRAAQRRLALLVDAVLGVTRIEREALAHLPPALGDANRETISAIGARDAALLVVLDAARVLPEDCWRAIGDRSQ
jgi:purine-binding chemotaxis protein CheW